MREYGIRRYGDTTYRHCLADSPEAAANWFAHAAEGLEGKDFQALVLDISLPEVGLGGGKGDNPRILYVRHGPLTADGRNATDLERTSPLR